MPSKPQIQPPLPAPNDDGSTSPRPSASQPDQWVDEHGDALFRYALIRVRDRSTAEDLVQETLLAALKSRSDFRGDSQLRTWLIGILRHKIMDHLRQAGRLRTLDESDETDSLIDGWFKPNGMWANPPKQWDVDPAQLAQRQEFWTVLEDCMKSLPGRSGDAFSMRVMGEVPPKDVCKVLGITPTNLWVLLHRARARLRACLEAKWFGSQSEEKS